MSEYSIPQQAYEPAGVSLRQTRIVRGVSQRKLARLSGVSLAQIGNLEAGRHQPHRSTAIVLSAVLDCEPSDIFPSYVQRPGGENPGVAKTADAGGGLAEQ